MSDSLAVIIALLQQYSNSHCSFLRYINVINTDIINKKRQMLYNTHSKPIWRQYSSKTNKKLSYRRETVRHFLSWNILRSHSMSLNITRNDTVEQGMFIPFKLCPYCTVSEIFSVENGVTLKPGVGGFKVTENDAVQQITYDFLLVGHCKHSSMLYHFRVI